MTRQAEIKKTAQESEAEDVKESDVGFSNMIGLGFLLSNLLFMVLFYAYVYDAEGTSKPGCSEMLG